MTLTTAPTTLAKFKLPTWSKLKLRASGSGSTLPASIYIHIDCHPVITLPAPTSDWTLEVDLTVSGDIASASATLRTDGADVTVNGKARTHSARTLQLVACARADGKGEFTLTAADVESE